MGYDAGARTQHDEILEGDAAAQAALRDDDAMVSDRAIVSDLAEVIDFRTLADDGVAHAAPIDPRSGSDLDIVVNNDPADLRNLYVSVGIGNIAEAVLADVTAGINRNAIAKPAVADRTIGADGAILADVNVVGDDGMCAYQASGSDPGRRADHGKGIDRHAASDLRRRMYRRQRRDADGAESRAGTQRALMDLTRDGDERVVWLSGLQDCYASRRLWREPFGRQHNAGARRREGLQEFRIADEAEVHRAGAVDRRDAGDAPGQVGSFRWPCAGHRHNFLHAKP